jgi:hypothetical protein
VAASCVLSITGAVQVTMRALPEPCASDGALGVLAIWDIGVGVGVGVGVGELGIPSARIVAMGRFAGRGVGRYIGIFLCGSC